MTSILDIEALIQESADLTKALTGLTCGGSEFFIRKGDRYVADIDACVAWVRRRDSNAHERWRSAASKLLDAEAREAALIAQRDALLDAVKDTRALISEGGLTGFNPLDGDWAERLFRNQGKLTAAITLATGGGE